MTPNIERRLEALEQATGSTAPTIVRILQFVAPGGAAEPTTIHTLDKVHTWHRHADETAEAFRARATSEAEMLRTAQGIVVLKESNAKEPA